MVEYEDRNKRVIHVPDIKYLQGEGWCGPIATRVSLACQGIIREQEELAELLDASHQEGCNPIDFVRAAHNLGLVGWLKYHSCLGELEWLIRQGIPPIIGMHTPEAGDHYVTGLGFRRRNIVYADPQFEEIREMNRDVFERFWFGCYDLQPRRKSDIYERLVIVIHPRDKTVHKF